MTYNEALAYIESTVTFGGKPGLRRIRGPVRTPEKSAGQSARCTYNGYQWEGQYGGHDGVYFTACGISCRTVCFSLCRRFSENAFSSTAN